MAFNKCKKILVDWGERCGCDLGKHMPVHASIVNLAFKTHKTVNSFQLAVRF